MCKKTVFFVFIRPFPEQQKQKNSNNFLIFWVLLENILDILNLTGALNRLKKKHFFTLCCKRHITFLSIIITFRFKFLIFHFSRSKTCSSADNVWQKLKWPHWLIGCTWQRAKPERELIQTQLQGQKTQWQAVEAADEIFFSQFFFFNPGERKENLAPRQTCSRNFKHARHFLCTQAARISQDESGGIGSIYITAGFGIKIGTCL